MAAVAAGVGAWILGVGGTADPAALESRDFWTLTFPVMSIASVVLGWLDRDTAPLSGGAVGLYSATPIIRASSTEELWVVSLGIWFVIVLLPLMGLAYAGGRLAHRSRNSDGS